MGSSSELRSDRAKYRCATSEKILMNTADGLFPRWAWDTREGELVARCEDITVSKQGEKELTGDEAYRVLMQALGDPTADVERVCPRATPFAEVDDE